MVVSQDSTNLSRAECLSIGIWGFTLPTLPDGWYANWQIFVMNIAHSGC